MGAKSRRKGADAEREVVRAAVNCGVPAQRVIRTATSRDPDAGDVHLLGGRVVVQVKAGEAAKTASRAQILNWLDEVNEQATYVPAAWTAVLVVQPRGIGATRVLEWHAYVYADDIHAQIPGNPPIMLTFHNFLEAL